MSAKTTTFQPFLFRSTSSRVLYKPKSPRVPQISFSLALPPPAPTPLTPVTPSLNSSSSSSSAPLLQERAEVLTVNPSSFVKTLSSQKAPSRRFPISSGAVSAAYGVSDFDWFVRNLIQNITKIQPGLQPIGVTTIENLGLGIIEAVRGYRNLRSLQKINDTAGKKLGVINIIGAVIQAWAGLAFTGFRPLDIITAKDGIDSSMTATTSIGRATFGLGLAGNILFGLFFACFGAVGIYQSRLIGRFYSRLNAQDSPTKVAEFLISQAYADTSTKLKKLKEKFKIQPKQKEYKASLQEKALDALSEQCMQMYNGRIDEQIKQKAENPDQKMSREEARGFVSCCFDNLDPATVQEFQERCLEGLGIQEEEASFLNLSPLELYGLKVSEEMRQLKKDSKCGRLIDGRSIELIKKAEHSGLTARLNSTDSTVEAAAQKELQTLEKGVRSALRTNLIVFASLVAVSLLGIISTIGLIGLFAVPPGWLIALTLITIAMTIGMGGVDLYFWHQGINSGRPGPYDKLFLAIGVFLMTVAVVASAVLTFGFGFPLAAFIWTLIIAIPCFGFTGFSYYKLGALEKKWLADHPTLEQFQEKLTLAASASQGTDTGWLERELIALYKKLPKEDRLLVREKLKAMGEALEGPSAAEFLETAVAKAGQTVLERVCETLNEREDISDKLKGQIEEFSKLLQGYRGKDLESIITQARTLRTENPKLLKDKTFLTLMKSTREAIRREDAMLERACKKSCKVFWKQYKRDGGLPEEKTTALERAIQMQHFYELVKQQGLIREERRTGTQSELTRGQESLQAQRDTLQNLDCLGTLQQNIAFIRTREEKGTTSLKQAVVEVLEDKEAHKQKQAKEEREMIARAQAQRAASSSAT